MKKAILLILSVLFISSNIISAKEILLKVPVRVFDSGNYVKNLKIGDFDLEINGVKRNIRKVIATPKMINLSEKPNTFILNFNITEYGEGLSNGIKYFINKTLGENDSLILWTPIKFYSIRTNQKKEKIILNIKQLLKKDSLTFKSFRKGDKGKLISILNKFTGSGLEGNSRDSGASSTNIMFFLNNFSREWKDFKKKYLLPDLRKYYGLISMIDAGYPGNKYFINFQQREIIPSLKLYRQAKKIISSHLSSIAGSSQSSTSASISNSLQMIDNSMLIKDSFSTEILSAPFLKSNISYNVIFLNSFRQTGKYSDDLSPDYEGILRDLSYKTGGISINTNNLADGLNEVKEKQDYYYDIIFKFNGKNEEKKINIKTKDKKYSLFYLKKFHREEIENLIKLSQEKKIEISGFSIEKNRIKFSITGFLSNASEKKQGIVGIEIYLFDKNNKVVFSKTGTFKATKDSIGISLNLPSANKGAFKLSIKAKDILSNKNSEFEKYIELK